MPIEVHCHGDLGMAVANVAGEGAKGTLDAGQDVYINTTINGNWRTSRKRRSGGLRFWQSPNLKIYIEHYEVANTY